jgi:hypothetical protein
VASGEVDAERNGAATVPALAGGDAANERDAVTLDRDVCASGADSPHMGGAVAGDRDGRCFALPHILPDALVSCTPKGRCKVGWIVTNGGRDAYDVWLDLKTGEGRLRRRVD